MSKAFHFGVVLFSRRWLRYVHYRSSVCLSSVCLSVCRL